ncbi:hypothetical protein CPSG_10116 [Coccidioides posadasii str. Silveira]|uniref:Uncharacterized protein n=1 Tax=Coccidioides posadasii (strain RMSCC 757 / Silveira) TaxID=443226 RepID=E9DJW7_COCPS|nr:hypothetical protein CPSG_10116 [Coccidioides posadasii str. Silveira]
MPTTRLAPPIRVKPHAAFALVVSRRNKRCLTARDHQHSSASSILSGIPPPPNAPSHSQGSQSFLPVAPKTLLSGCNKLQLAWTCPISMALLYFNAGDWLKSWGTCFALGHCQQDEPLPWTIIRPDPELPDQPTHAFASRSPFRKPGSNVNWLEFNGLSTVSEVSFYSSRAFVAS